MAAAALHIQSNRKGGGTMLQLHKNEYVYFEVEANIGEAVAAFISYNQLYSELFLIVTLYIPTPLDKTNFVQELDDVLKSLSLENQQVITARDVNIRVLKTNMLGQRYVKSIGASGIRLEHKRDHQLPPKPFQPFNFCINAF